MEVVPNVSELELIIKESQKRIKKSLIDGFEYHHLATMKSNRYLRKHDSQKLDFSVMFVDLVGSTKMSTELAPDFLSKIITVYSQEMAYAIEYYGGLVLKYVGDAIIGYFPSTGDNSGISKGPSTEDNIVKCGNAIVHIARSAINPFLLQQGHDGIQVKLTADYGQNTIVRYGSDKKRAHIDIISVTMNLAAKMQSLVGAGRMVIGYNLYNRLTEAEKRRFQNLKTDRDHWHYHNLSSHKTYPIYATSF